MSRKFTDWRESTADPLPVGRAVTTNVPKEKKAVLWLGPGTQGPPLIQFFGKNVRATKEYGGTSLHLTFHLALG